MKSARMSGNGARLFSIAFAMFMLLSAVFELMRR